MGATLHDTGLYCDMILFYADCSGYIQYWTQVNYFTSLSVAPRLETALVPIIENPSNVGGQRKLHTDFVSRHPTHSLLKCFLQKYFHVL